MLVSMVPERGLEWRQDRDRREEGVADEHWSGEGGGGGAVVAWGAEMRKNAIEQRVDA
jgi:hypothetical protein